MLAVTLQHAVCIHVSLQRVLVNFQLCFTMIISQYLVQVKNKDVTKVPSDWTRISGCVYTQSSFNCGLAI